MLQTEQERRRKEEEEEEKIKLWRFICSRMPSILTWHTHILGVWRNSVMITRGLYTTSLSPAQQRKEKRRKGILEDKQRNWLTHSFSLILVLSIHLFIVTLYRDLCIIFVSFLASSSRAALCSVKGHHVPTVQYTTDSTTSVPSLFFLSSFHYVDWVSLVERVLCLGTWGVALFVELKDRKRKDEYMRPLREQLLNAVIFPPQAVFDE